MWFQKKTLIEEGKNELNKIKEIGKTVDSENLVYRTNEYIYSYKNFQTIDIFGRDIFYSTVTLNKADKDQNSLLVEIINFKSKIKPQKPEKNNILYTVTHCWYQWTKDSSTS